MSAGILKRPVVGSLAFILALALPALADKPYEETAVKHSWISFSRPAKTSSVEQLAYAKELLAQESLRSATKQFRALTLTWPGSPEAPEAQLNLARLLDQRGKSQDAFDAYQVLMEKYPGRFPYADILARQMDIAVELGERRRFTWLRFAGFKSPERAIPMLEKILQNGPAWSRAAEAQYRIGAAYEDSKQEDLAVGAYLLCEERYPQSDYTEPSALSRARCWFILAEDNPNDEATLEEAYAAALAYIRRYKDTEDYETVRSYQRQIYARLARQAYDRAFYYDRMARKPAAAIRAYETVQLKFPASPLAARAGDRIAVLRAAKESAR